MRSEADESARLAEVSPAERMRLEAGAVVTRPVDFERGDAHYVGGVAAGLVRASPERVMSAINDVDALSAMLPLTKRVSFVGQSGPARKIELLQGNSVVDALYTVELRKDDSPGEVTFHMDRSRRHDIDDVYGYFKVERFDETRSLVTVAAAVDIGSGMTHLLFDKRVQDVILSTPYVMRGYFSRLEPAGSDELVARK